MSLTPERSGRGETGGRGRREELTAVGLIRGAAARFQIPITPNLPLRPTEPGERPYPLVIFSHGICGTRSTYSQWCQALASEGYVVLAVEHADGSSPCVLLPDGELPFTVLKELE